MPTWKLVLFPAGKDKAGKSRGAACAYTVSIDFPVG